MVDCGYVISVVLLVFTCLTEAKVSPKSHENVTTSSGHKRIDVQVSKWRQAQNAINSLIDESISNEVFKAKKEVKALLEKNIAKHLHEASRKVMQGTAELENDGTEYAYDIQDDGACRDQFDNCATLAQSGVCESSRDAMKKHCERTCELCDAEDEELPPAAVEPAKNDGKDSWTIIGTDGRRFTSDGIQRGTRKASITTAQVERLLEYVKKHAPHLQLKKIKPGVLKLVRVEKKKPNLGHKLSFKKKKEAHHHDASYHEAKHHEAGHHEAVHHEDTRHEDVHHDNYWTIKEKKKDNGVEKTSKGPYIHFDLSSILKDSGDLKEEKVPEQSMNHVQVHHRNHHKSEEYLKHICHPMCKKTCISSCAPGCCAGEGHHDFPLYHRKSSHCHPLCKKHCISACPLTCCADTHTTSKTWHHRHVQRFTAGCHPMCKKNCVPSCPKACCTPKPVKPRSHCHPLCKTHCLSSCPLSCCSKRDRRKEMCHPLCRKTCLPSCAKECCRTKRKKLIVKEKPKSHQDTHHEIKCPGKCPDSCAPACHSGCCNKESDEKPKMTTAIGALTHPIPSGCTANCVYSCIPGCPPACCQKSSSHEVPQAEMSAAPVMMPFTQPLLTTFAMPGQPVVQPMMPMNYQPEEDSSSVASTISQAAKLPEMSVMPQQSESTNFFAPKHCSSACLTHCSPECARSDCCDLDK